MIEKHRPSTPNSGMVLLGALFFVFGLVSWVNSILVPYFKVACDLQSEVQGYLAQFAFYIAYLVMTIPASALLSRTGYKKGALIGLWILALGAFLFIPAALTRVYNMFLVALFTMAALPYCLTLIWCPLVYASIADGGASLHTAYWILIPAALYMVFYAFMGYKINHWRL